MTLEPLLSPEEVAQAVGLHYQTVLDRIRAGELPAVRLGNRWRIRPADYHAWLEANRPLPPTIVTPALGPAPMRPRRKHRRRERPGGPGSLARLEEIEREAKDASSL